MPISEPVNRWEAARAEWDRDMRVEAGRARLAVIALGATAVLHGVEIVAAAGGQTESMAPALSIGEPVSLLVTAVLFLRWLHRAVAFTAIMNPTRLKWTPAAAVWGFFMPIVGLWRPYQVVRDVHDALAPDAVPEPAPRPRLDGAGGYRHVEMERAPAPAALPHASIGWWWGLFVGARVLGLGDAQRSTWIGAAVSILSAILGGLVVRAIDGRLAERFRRVRHASDEELSAWEVRA